MRELMAGTTRKQASYLDLHDIPENVVGEILNGELTAMLRPARRCLHAASSLGAEIMPAYQFGKGSGPGGWTVYHEPEVQLGENTVVPDLAAWKNASLVSLSPEARMDVAPDWVCEVLSPTTLRADKVRKMPIYARFGIPFLWLVNPLVKNLDVFALEAGRWTLTGSYSEDDVVRAEPFQKIEIELRRLWID
ncbi:MAG: Uma2 family endonuclease [Syntrophobacteraceae bacterium]|nr:Uma2 family endonuclease [Desulfobacteraceae bacterium]